MLVGEVVKLKSIPKRVVFKVEEVILNENTATMLSDVPYKPGETYKFKEPKGDRFYRGEWVIYERYPGYIWLGDSDVGLTVIAAPGYKGITRYIPSAGEEERKIRLMFQKDWYASLDDDQIVQHLKDFDLFHLLYEEAELRGILSTALLAEAAKEMGNHIPLEYHLDYLFQQNSESSMTPFILELVDYSINAQENGNELIKDFVLNYIQRFPVRDWIPAVYRIYHSEGNKTVEESYIKNSIAGTLRYFVQEPDVTDSDLDMCDDMMYDWALRHGRHDLYILQQYLEAAPLRCDLINRFLSSMEDTTVAEDGIVKELLDTIEVYIDEHPSDCYDIETFRQISESLEN